MVRKLYTTPFCAYCTRVRDALERLGLSYEEVSVGWTLADREEVFRLTGQRRVPVLDDGGEVVYDSARILAHLDQTYSKRAP